MESEKLARSVNVCERCNWHKRPPDKLFHHEHSQHAGSKAGSSSVAPGSHVYVVAVLTTSNIHPVLFNWRLVLADFAVEDVLGKELHP